MHYTHDHHIRRLTAARTWDTKLQTTPRDRGPRWDEMVSSPRGERLRVPYRRFSDTRYTHSLGNIAIRRSFSCVTRQHDTQVTPTYLGVHGHLWGERETNLIDDYTITNACVHMNFARTHLQVREV